VYHELAFRIQTLFEPKGSSKEKPLKNWNEILKEIAENRASFVNQDTAMEMEDVQRDLPSSLPIDDEQRSTPKDLPSSSGIVSTVMVEDSQQDVSVLRQDSLLFPHHQ
jgi:hypothetical protein